MPGPGKHGDLENAVFVSLVSQIEQIALPWWVHDAGKSGIGPERKIIDDPCAPVVRSASRSRGPERASREPA